MRIGWTVNCEIFFYLLFFIAFHISHKYRGLICSILVGLPVFVNALFPSVFAPLRFFGDPVMLDFVLGIGCYYIAKGIYDFYQSGVQRRLWNILSWTALAFGIFLFVVLVITKPGINILSFRRPLLWGIPAFLLVLAFFLAGLTLRMPRPLVFVGNMSFSLYLIHYYPVMLLDRVIFDFSAFTPFAALGVVISIIICLICSYICWYLIEKKLTKVLQKLFLK